MNVTNTRTQLAISKTKRGHRAPSWPAWYIFDLATSQRDASWRGRGRGRGAPRRRGAPTRATLDYELRASFYSELLAAALPTFEEHAFALLPAHYCCILQRPRIGSKSA